MNLGRYAVNLHTLSIEWGQLGVAVESLKSCSLISFHGMVSVRDQKFVILIFHKLKFLASDKLFIGKKKKNREKNVYLRLWYTAKLC